MAENPFKLVKGAPRLQGTEALKAAVDRGNDYLEEIGRRDVHWYVHEGQLCIGFRGRPGA
jgi:hypothetical protein